VNFQTTQLTVSAISGSASAAKQKEITLFLFFLKIVLPQSLRTPAIFYHIFYTIIQHFGRIDKNV
jgi:hypothetical protein